MKKAFSILEIIIAIIVIASGVSVIPYIINANTNSNQGALLQEAITSSKTKLLDVMSFPWNSLAMGYNTSVPIFIFDDVNKDYNKSNYFANPRNTAPVNSSNRLELLNNRIIKGGINNFNNDTGNVTLNTANDSSKSKNILSLNYKISMGYLSKPQNDLKNSKKQKQISTVFENKGTTTNQSIALMIKIDSSTTNLDKDKDITLVGYSFDIGEPKYEKRIIK